MMGKLLKVFILLLILLPLTKVCARDFGGLLPSNQQFELDTNATAINFDGLVDCELGVPSKDPDCRELQDDNTLPAITPTSTVPTNLLTRPINFSALINALTAIRNILNNYSN